MGAQELLPVRPPEPAASSARPGKVACRMPPWLLPAEQALRAVLGRLWEPRAPVRLLAAWPPQAVEVVPLALAPQQPAQQRAPAVLAQALPRRREPCSCKTLKKRLKRPAAPREMFVSRVQKGLSARWHRVDAGGRPAPGAAAAAARRLHTSGLLPPFRARLPAHRSGAPIGPQPRR